MDYSVKDIAQMIDHSLLHPTMTDEEVKKGCEIAKEYGMATACVKPLHADLAYSVLKGSGTQVCAVIGFPHGNSTTKIKVAETKQALKDGAAEIDMVIHAGKVLAKDWRYIKKDIAAVNKACVKSRAILKVIFENDFIPDDATKIKLCKICNAVKVAFVKTSTGYGYVKQANGDYNYKGATVEDIKLMRKYTDPSIQIKGAGGIRNLDDLLKYRELGVTRIGATASVAMIEEAKRRLGMQSGKVKAVIEPHGY
jgi:deoxyribose-phosphate aldolase